MKFRFDRDKLKALRESLGLSQYAFGFKVNIPPQIISQYETGRQQPRITTLLKIVSTFRLPSDYFFVHDNSHSDKSRRKVKA